MNQYCSPGHSKSFCNTIGTKRTRQMCGSKSAWRSEPDTASTLRFRPFMTTTVQAPVCYGDTAAKMSKIESTKSPAAKNRNSGDMAKLGSRRFFNTPENIRHASSAARSKHRAKRTLSAGQPNAMIARCRLAGARSPSEGRTLDLSVPRLPRSAHLCRQGSQRAADEIQIRARP